MRLTAWPLLGVLMAASACASVRNTPAQDLAWERWRACDHFATVTLDRIELDGRLVVAAQQLEAAPFTACVARAASEQVERGVAERPDAPVFVKLYGCMGGAM